MSAVFYVMPCDRISSQLLSSENENMRTIPPRQRSRMEVSLCTKPLFSSEISTFNIRNVIIALLVMAVVIESSESIYKIMKTTAKNGSRALEPMATSRPKKLNEVASPSSYLHDIFARHDYIEYDNENDGNSEAIIERRLTTPVNERLHGHRHSHHRTGTLVIS